MEASDHYATLGLDRRCTAAQIRSAYRLLVKRHHPDLHRSSPAANARAQELNAAHETLSDPARREAYDRELSRRERPAPERQTSKIARNISRDANLRVEDFFRGVSLEIKINDPANPNGPETYSLIVPEDTAPGSRFRLPRDEPFDGGVVIVRVKARPDYRFKPKGSDLRCDLRVSAQRAAQGGVETMAGPAGRLLRVAIPPGIARNAVIRIAGEGLPRPRGGRGDLLVRVTYRPEIRVTRIARESRGWKRLS